MKNIKKQLSQKDKEIILNTLKNRIVKNNFGHKGIDWTKVLAKLESNTDKLWSIYQMEETGGEPDIVSIDKKSGLIYFFDCSQESPKGRRSICYDQEALESRKEHKPKTSAMEMAKGMGIEILSEEQYRFLQSLGNFDSKTSSWILTPPSIRKLGGAIFGDWRYGQVFIYHNGAESYYGVRGFRGCIAV
ncbi:DUF4256 domain-containing protein [Leptospira sp. GIMC2001]|uniref:DUF4256 domain-containing protein n=1 Tax=Leptospira sp. GIMC2001 TaxID=1513297 RepID=UPI0023491D13|nr:DUF4256 domain-containing protein [Leptospira sp. GIMC2001]WCL51169.1 DUF4256 domain-containing protein [Leptospira sp. GIMC2001]